MVVRYHVNVLNHVVIQDIVNVLVEEISVEQIVFVMIVKILIHILKATIKIKNKKDVDVPNLNALKIIVSVIKKEENVIKNVSVKIVKINDIVHIYYFLLLD